ncbi:hypothetical protein C8R41DRAFT_926366 [Lentinula lateritia]|uniref:Uncharacterized protein n=1 Tax=Lentinula lateritia TaxID=40482 RepID=A0ABQ8V2E7_9AGAR|nr:hypothetical protein C8R41DRAFT_926366 [Lentinula lateritia]
MIPLNKESGTPHSFQETITPDLHSAVMRLKLHMLNEEKAHVVITIPSYFSEQEEQTVFDTFQDLDIFLPYPICHAEIFRHALAAGERYWSPRNELVLNIGDNHAGVQLCMSDSEDGIFSTKVIAGIVCDATVEGILQSIHSVLQTLETDSLTTGPNLHAFLTTHLPTKPMQSLVTELSNKLPSLAFFCITTTSPELQAAEEAFRRVTAQVPLFISSLTALRLGIETVCKNVLCILIPKTTSVPRICSRYMVVSGGTATVNLVAGGPLHRVPLGTINITGVTVGQKVLISLEIDEHMSGNMLVSEVLLSGGRGNLLGHMEIESIAGGLNRRELNRAVNADQNIELDDLVSECALPE